MVYLPKGYLPFLYAGVTLSRSPHMLRNIIKIKTNGSINNKYIKKYMYKKIINKLKLKTSKNHFVAHRESNSGQCDAGNIIQLKGHISLYVTTNRRDYSGNCGSCFNTCVY